MCLIADIFCLGLYYIRGNKADYDAWEQLGNPGWNWDTLLPYFLRSEKFAIPTNAQREVGMSYDPRYHGEEGPVNTGFIYTVENGSFYDSARETSEKLGFSLNPELNGGNNRGFGSYPKTLDREANVRESAARAYYEPIDGRQNLKVVHGTVKRIVFGNSSAHGGELVATGLEYTDEKGDLQTVTAKREVILSTGTYVSPLILEASGIGNPGYARMNIQPLQTVLICPCSVLSRAGVQPRLELPAVGEGFQDQPLWVLMFQVKRKLTGQVPFAAFSTARDIFGAETDSLDASTQEKLASWSEQIAKRLEGGVSASALEKRFQVQHDAIFDKKASIAEYEFFSLASQEITGMVFSTTLPFSWGSVHLDAAGEIEKPVIDPNFLSVDFDLHAAKQVGKIARKLWSTEPLSDFVGDLIAPADGVLPGNATDEQWAQFLTSTCEYNLGDGLQMCFPDVQRANAKKALPHPIPLAHAPCSLVSWAV